MRGILVYDKSLSPTKFRNLKSTVYVFSVTYYLELHNAKAFVKNEIFWSSKIIYVVYYLYNISFVAWFYGAVGRSNQFCLWS